MKRIVFLSTLLSAFIFSSCSKSNNDNASASSIKTIRYDFTTTNAANYGIQAIADTLIYSDSATALTWSKTITVMGSDSAFFAVYPPVAWVNTTNAADVSLKIFVNNVEKASNTAHFIGLDRPNGLKISTAY